MKPKPKLPRLRQSVFLRAANTISNKIYCCWALGAARVTDAEFEFFETNFKPENPESEGQWFGSPTNPENQARRIAALKACAEMIKQRNAKERKRVRG